MLTTYKATVFRLNWPLALNAKAISVPQKTKNINGILL